MKFLLVSLVALVASFSVAQADDQSSLIDAISAVQLRSLAAVHAEDLINWQVGDTSSYNVDTGFLPGTMIKSVTKEEGTTGLWIEEDIDLTIQKQQSQILIDKSTGKILKMIVNGQEQQVPDENLTIISQDYQSVTVPAGTFKTVHVLAKSTDSPRIEVWVNNKDVCMDGTVKQSMDTVQQGQTMTITLELTSFKRAGT